MQFSSLFLFKLKNSPDPGDCLSWSGWQPLLSQQRLKPLNNDITAVKTDWHICNDFLCDACFGLLWNLLILLCMYTCELRWGQDSLPGQRVKLTLQENVLSSFLWEQEHGHHLCLACEAEAGAQLSCLDMCDTALCRCCHVEQEALEKMRLLGPILLLYRGKIKPFLVDSLWVPAGVSCFFRKCLVWVQMTSRGGCGLSLLAHPAAGLMELKQCLGSALRLVLCAAKAWTRWSLCDSFQVGGFSDGCVSVPDGDLASFGGRSHARLRGGCSQLCLLLSIYICTPIARISFQRFSTSIYLILIFTYLMCPSHSAKSWWVWMRLSEQGVWFSVLQHLSVSRWGVLPRSAAIQKMNPFTSWFLSLSLKCCHSCQHRQVMGLCCRSWDGSQPAITGFPWKLMINFTDAFKGPLEN